jgi:4-amino-4-deoxy-L-arabinose transferase-like glycosyltransferase
LSRDKEKWILASFLVGSGLVLLFNVGARSLENHDYLRYAEISREMIRSGQWVVPRYNGEVYIDKPPLLFWLIALPSFLYGSVTPLIARLPSVFAAWIGVVTACLWSRRIYGTIRSGLVSGGVLLTTYQFFFQARSAKTDTLLCTAVLLSLYFFYRAYERLPGISFLFCGLSFFFMGLGVLTKGPFGIVIPMAVVAAFLLKEKRLGILVSRPFLFGYLVFGLTVLPWIALFVKTLGWGQTVSLIQTHRILTRKAPVYFYFVQIWFEFFPWSLLIPAIFIYLWRKREGRMSSGEFLMVLWFGLLLVLLTCFKYRAARYLLPGLPPMAILIGGMWRGRLLTVFVPVCLALLVWYGVEFSWLLRNSSNSPGKALSAELASMEGAVFSGFRLDVSTLEEINFYLDRVVPVIKKTEPLPGNRLVLMPEKVYRGVVAEGHGFIQLIRDFQYKGGRLFLVSTGEKM